jgi:nucleotide-binding universal stress UspA family protein
VTDTDPGPVVVGFDGTPTGEDALSLARWCGQLLGTGVIVAVVHPAPAAIGTARVDAEWVADRHRLAESILDAARAVLGNGNAEYRVVSSSSAAHGLHDLAELTGASLIVTGSRAKGPEQRLFAGSTADRLLSGSVCPIAVAPVGMRTRRPGPPVRIGVGYIDTAEANAALDVAARLAVRTGAELRLYSVIPGEAEVLPLGIGHDGDHAYTAAAREAFQRALDLAIAGLPSGVRATGTILPGHPAEVLAGLGDDEIDLLICGSRGYGPVRRVLLGGVSSKLVRAAHTPLIVVPRAG